MVGIKEDWIGIVENGAKEIRENYGLEAEVTHDLLGDKYQVIHKLLEDTPFIKEVRKGIEKLYGVGTETMHEVLRDTYLVVPAEGPLVPAKKIQPKVPYTDARWVESSEGIGIEWKLGKEDEFGRRSHLTKDDYGSLDKLIRDTMRQGGNVNIYGTEIEDFENLHDFAKDFYERLGIKEPEEGYEIDVGELQRYGSHAEKVDEGVIGYMRNPINDKEIKYVEGPYSLNIEKNGAKIISTISGEEYVDPDCGFICKSINPFDKEKEIIVIAGLESISTRAGVFAFKYNIDRINKGNMYKRKVKGKVIKCMENKEPIFLE